VILLDKGQYQRQYLDDKFYLITMYRDSWILPGDIRLIKQSRGEIKFSLAIPLSISVNRTSDNLHSTFIALATIYKAQQV
jgi:hypothetical protein